MLHGQDDVTLSLIERVPHCECPRQMLTDKLSCGYELHGGFEKQSIG